MEIVKKQQTWFFMVFPLFGNLQVMVWFYHALQLAKQLARCVQIIPVQMSAIQNSDDNV